VSDSPQIAYIAGPTHSGSTLLDLLMGSHSEVESLGELKVLSPRRGDKRARVLADRCTCGAPFKLACEFWRAVDARIRGQVGCGLADLDLDAADPTLFLRHNAALFRAAAEVGGRSWIVDSSKSGRRLARLLRAGRFDVRPVLLSRGAYALAYSHVRKGRGAARAAWRAGSASAGLAWTLAGRARIAVDYEALAARPAETLERVMAGLGLAFEKSQLAWTARTHHLLSGNHMRFSESAEIRADDAWREALSPLQRGVIAAVARPLQAVASLASLAGRTPPTPPSQRRSTSR
jgi:hypothetical protein